MRKCILQLDSELEEAKNSLQRWENLVRFKGDEVDEKTFYTWVFRMRSTQRLVNELTKEIIVEQNNLMCEFKKLAG